MAKAKAKVKVKAKVKAKAKAKGKPKAATGAKKPAKAGKAKPRKAKAEKARPEKARGAKTAKSPAALGYRMPAEWEPHRATWIAWPHEREDWPGKFEPIPWVFAEVVAKLTRDDAGALLPPENVCILVADKHMERRAARILAKANVNAARVEFYRIPTDRCWTRDSGPLFLKNEAGEVAATVWRFNGWAKYDNHLRDEKVSDRISAIRRAPAFEVKLDYGARTQRMVLEGGAIDVNGEGTLLTTEECLLSEVQARNPGVARGVIERALCDQLGVEKIIWLGNGIAGDDTHGHVDDLARFVGPHTVVLAEEPDPADPNHAALAENRRLLEASSNQDGRAIEVIPLPMPAPVYFRGQRLPASYANFYIGNRAVLVPTFNDPNDRVALNTLAELFPEREVVGIHALDLVWGLGTLHCMTQQEPRAGD